LSGPRIATANPLSNACHIGAYPFRHADGQLRFEIGDAELDALAASIQPVRRAAVHLTVGFCQYIRRAAIDEIGVFDAENFPVGYGEESDFCYRARRLGWRHVVTGDVFVRHWEGQSFGQRKAQLMARMIETFNRLHPDLGANDRDFAARDPIRPLREALDLARLKRLLGGAATLPCLDEAAASRATAPGLAFDAAKPVARLVAPGVPTLASLPSFALPWDVAALNTALARLGVGAIVFDGAVPRDRFAALVRGRPGEVTVEVAMELAGQAA
jgi:hypothetical protein